MRRLLFLTFTLQVALSSCSGDSTSKDSDTGTTPGDDMSVGTDVGSTDTGSAPDDSGTIGNNMSADMTSLPDLDVDMGPTTPETCSNGSTDGDETDVDCGGSCEPCAADLACGENDDCASGACLGDVCRINSWTRVADLPVARAELTAAVGADGRVYVFGGSIAGVPQDDVHIYNPTLDAWAAGEPLPTARAELRAATASDDRIYVIGGQTERDAFGYTDGTTRVVESYDPSTDSWRTEPELPEGHGGGGAVWYNDQIVVFGGVGGGDLEDGIPGTPNPNTIAFTPGGSWTALGGRLSRDQMSFGYAVIPGVGIAAAGGWRVHLTDTELLDTMDLYDGSAWFSRSTLPSNRERPTAAESGGVLYVFGGLTTRGNTRIARPVAAYIPADNAWTEIGNVPQPSLGGAAVTLPDGRIMLVGGFVGQTPRSATADVWIYTP